MYKNLNTGALGHSVSFTRACELAKQHGFAGVDLDLADLLKQTREKSIDAALDEFGAYGLKPGAFGLSVKWRDSDNEAAFASSLAQFVEEVRLAALFNCSRCVTWVMPGSNTHDFRAHWRLAAPRLKYAASILSDHGMRLGLEFVGPATLRARFQHDFIHTMDAMLGFAAEIGDNVGLLLDCFHWFTSRGEIQDIERLRKEDVIYVHVNDAKAGRSANEQIDNEREMVGASGVIDIEAFMRTLQKIDCDAPLTVEPFNQAVREMKIDDAVAMTSRALDKLPGMGK
jgi:sugar phosphate isomerase/epimerase